MKGLIHCMLIAIAISGALVSCTYEELIPPKVEVPDSVKFSANIIPIFNTSCNSVGCHSKSGIPPDLTEANAYNSLIFFGYVDTDVPESSILYEKITTGSMKDNATDQDRALILEWIKQGALDN
ncbi:MAG: hypothetical protein OEV74_14330 [Cyclobacteriaceae bacterium]|nr:hypothetical protein [Cyclobacteriaceae bacterium]MDH4297458.1 hypothetical protein [Cyclobacteriaceae bacterium]MDH5250665.1 hypothetical protein [Cyclobacteriaceae bacterium]